MFDIKALRYKNILDIEELHIPRNQITCIVGQSGSGKTTLLRMLNKLVSPDSGEINYKGHPLREMDSTKLRREVVMLPQMPAIFDGDIRHNLLIGLRFADKKEAEDSKLKDVLKMVHLNKSLDEKAEKLSGGEKQRLALGRIMLLEPEVLLLDEPSSALDEETEQLIIEGIVDFAKRKGKTLIMVTHSKKVAGTYGDYIVEIKSGRAVMT